MEYLSPAEQLSVPTCILLAEWQKDVVSPLRFAFFCQAASCQAWNRDANGILTRERKGVDSQVWGDIIGENQLVEVNP